jgi:hypothetical protein
MNNLNIKTYGNSVTFSGSTSFYINPSAFSGSTSFYINPSAFASLPYIQTPLKRPLVPPRAIQCEHCRRGDAWEFYIDNRPLSGDCEHCAGTNVRPIPAVELG